MFTEKHGTEEFPARFPHDSRREAVNNCVLKSKPFVKSLIIMAMRSELYLRRFNVETMSAGGYSDKIHATTQLARNPSILSDPSILTVNVRNCIQPRGDRLSLWNRLNRGKHYSKEDSRIQKDLHGNHNEWLGRPLLPKCYAKRPAPHCPRF